MGSYWTLAIGANVVLTGKNYLPDEIMTIYREPDRYLHTDRQNEYYQHEPQDFLPKRLHDWVGYAISVRTLSLRLRLLGFEADQVWKEAEVFLQTELTDDDSHLADSWQSHGSPDADVLLNATIEYLIRSGIYAGLGKSRRDSLEGLYASVIDFLMEFYDPRFILALLCRGRRSNTVVRLNLTDVVDGGWIEQNELSAEAAEHRLRLQTSSSGRIIVVTEGSTDAKFVAKALEIVRPDVVEYFSFLDFATTSAPGGTDRVVSLTRGLAAAGVMNRIIAVLDNDCAGRDAEQQLLKSALPDHIGIMRLPDIDYAKSYPTIGPSGRNSENVNGRACTIEFMFGKGVLASSAGDPYPIRWKSYMPSVQDYQGELIDKSAVQKAISSALSQPQVDREVAKYAAQLIYKLIDAVPAIPGPYSSSRPR